VNVPAEDYLRRVREWCNEQGILLILDEVQTGTGRTGKLWGYEHTGVEPDIMTLAKGLGGGVPIGAMLAKNSCAVFEPGDHGSTFGGNALVTAAGAYVVRQLVEGGVLQNVNERGEQLERRLAGLEDRSPLVAGQRGVGLIRGLVLTQDIAADVATKAMAKGLLVNPVRPNVIRFLPPLNVTAEEIDEAVDIIDAALAEVAAG
jgi:acetylornithine/N-succinyldiaminopimelate aminotransferase